MLVLSRAEVRELLDVDALLDALATAMADVSAGRGSMPPRVAALLPEREALLAAMPGYVPSLGALSAKLVSLFPGNANTALPTHQAIIAVFDPATGEPVALLDGEEITATRTGAGSALSARLLAREDASVLAVLGTGVQARSHVAAMLRVRPIAEIRVAGRDAAKAERLARVLAEQHGVEVRGASSYEEAVRGADIVCAATHAVEPVVRGAWLAPGTHVTSVGFNTAGREVDDDAVAGALVCVESREAALAPPPAGTPDLLQPLANGVIDADHVAAEIGELVLGQHPGRTSPEQITMYKSVGIAAQDAAAAHLVVTAARARGAGRTLEL